MAQLNFSQVGNVYVATAQVDSDYNIHLERNKVGFIQLLHSTTQSGRKVFVKQWLAQELGGSDFDEDFDGLVYPKYLKIVSETEVTSGTITEV